MNNFLNELELSKNKAIKRLDVTLKDAKFETIKILLKENKKHTNDEIAEEIKKKTKSLDCEVSVSSSSMDTTSLGGSGINIMVKVDNLDKL